MADGKQLMNLWMREFPGEDPPGMTWNAESESLTISCDNSTIILDDEHSFDIARDNLQKEEDLILEQLSKVLYCRSCLNSVFQRSNVRRLSLSQLKEALGTVPAEQDPSTDQSDHVYDVYERGATKGRTKSENEEFLAPNMYSHPRKDRAKHRSRPALENLFINNGLVGVAASNSAVPGEKAEEEDDSGYDAVYEAIEDVQISQPTTAGSTSASSPIGGSMKLRSPFSRPAVPQRTFSLNKRNSAEVEESIEAMPESDRPYQRRPRTVFVDNPSAVAPPLPHRYQLSVKKVHSLPGGEISPNELSVFDFDEPVSGSSYFAKAPSTDVARHASVVSDVSEESSNYERVDAFKKWERPQNSNGIYYSPVSRSDDHDGIYEDISEASRLANSMGKQSELRQSSSSLVSDDGVLEPDELRNMIQSFSTRSVDADAVYASLPRKCLKNLTCSLTQLHEARGQPDFGGDYNVSLPDVASPSVFEISSDASTPTAAESSHQAEAQLDLDEMLGVLENDSQRKIYVASILENEKEYLKILDYLIKLKTNLSLLIMQGHTNTISLEDLSSVFFMIAEIHKVHEDFAAALEVKAASWSPDSTVAEIFHNWIRQLHIYEGFLRNYSKSLKTLQKCKSQTTNGVINDVLRELNGTRSRVPVSLEDLLMWPVNRMQRTSLYIEELLKRTPETNSDKEALKEALNNCSDFFAKYNKTEIAPVPSLGPRRILKSGFHVESDAVGIRKLRLLVLFSDAVACFKQVSGWALRLEGTNKSMYQLKWAISLGDLAVGLPAEMRKSTKDVEQMKAELQDLTAKLQQELAVEGGNDQEMPRRMSKTSNFKRMKKMWEQKVEMWSLESPSMLFMFWNRRPDVSSRKFMLLMSCDWTRQQWREAIEGQIQKFNAVYIHHRPVIEFEEIEMEANKSENRCYLPEITAFGSHLMERDQGFALSGMLSVKVGRAEGIANKITSFCRLEVDQYNSFEVVAKTNLVVDCASPHWNDEFPEIQLRSSHKLNILMYGTSDRGDEPIARGTFDLAEAMERRELVPNQVCEKSVELLHQQENYLDQKITVSIEVIFFPTACLAQSAIKTPKTKGYFGVRLKALTEREKSSANVPLLVSLCVSEVEKRGMTEQGIYRVNGYIRGINKLKLAFEEGHKNVAKSVSDADVHVITGVLKTFFRDLPHPLFTDLLFPRIAQAIEISSPDLKRRMMLDFFQMLPEPNKSTALAMLTHLVKVPRYSDANKMTLHALATVFGPTLVRPPPLNVVPEELPEAPSHNSHIIPSENLRLMQAAVIQNSCIHLYLQYLEEGYDLLTGGLTRNNWERQSQTSC